jgi:flagellar assembly factor FliW
MLFSTSLLGKVEVDESRIIEFPQGLPGFEHCTRFNLFHDASLEAPQVFWMQSLDDPDLLFSVVDPATLGVRYEIDLSDEEVVALKMSNPQEIAVLVMVYKDAQPDSEAHPLLTPIKSNIRNPLLLNLEARVGLQKNSLECDIVLHNHRHPA